MLELLFAYTGIASVLAVIWAVFLVRQWASSIEKRHPPTGQFIAVRGIRLHYNDTGGAGPPVVLLHGNGVTSRDWEISGVKARAGQQHRVIAFDRPGFGYSERPRTRLWTPGAQADLIQEALEALGITRAIVADHSFGAMVAVALAIRHPKLVAGLVTVSGYYFPTLRADAFLFSPPAIPLVGDLFRYTLAPLIGFLTGPLMMRVMFAPQPLPRRFIETFLALSVRPWQIRASSADGAYMIPAAMAFARRYSAIQAPMQIISGNEDKIVSPRRQSVRLHAVIPHSKLRILPGTGHMAHYAVRDAVIDAIYAVASESQASIHLQQAGKRRASGESAS